jgi:hypothetical protein
LFKNVLKLAMRNLHDALGKARFSSTVPSLLMSAPRKDEVPQSTATSF